jgi:hypothetical protein
MWKRRPWLCIFTSQWLQDQAKDQRTYPLTSRSERMMALWRR